MPADKLKRFGHFNARVLVPAVTEVTGLSDYNVKITPVNKGKKVVGVRLQWGAKSEEEIKAAFKELRSSRVGRLARLTGKVETLVAEAPRLPATNRVQIVEATPEPPKPTEQDRERKTDRRGAWVYQKTRKTPADDLELARRRMKEMMQ